MVAVSAWHGRVGEGLSEGSGRRPGPRTDAALIVLACTSTVLWIAAVGALQRTADFGQYGLLATPGGVLLAGSILCAATMFGVSLAGNRLIYAMTAILLVIVFQRVTVVLITEVPIYTWTYKHIGLVDYIIRNRSLAPAAVDIYNQWPGFFTAMAWFSSITGLDPVHMAHWFAPVVHALMAVLTGALARGLGLPMRAALAAAMITELLNWVGQDYFAPQATGLVMAIACLALLAHSVRYPVAGYISVAVFVVLVPSHQLTPIWLCACVVALAVFGKIRPVWLPLVYAAVVAAYLVPRLDQIRRYGMFTGSNPLANSSSNVPTRGSDGRVFTMLVDRSLSASMWVLALLCAAVIWRRVGMPWAAGIMAFSSMMLLGGQSYGGEAIFRVFLYSLPGCAVLIATVAVWALDLHGVRRRVTLLLVWLVAAVAVLASMQGYFGGWSYVTMTRNQLEQSRWLLSKDPAGATITVMAPAGWPERPTADYVGHALADSGYDKPLVFLKNSLSTGFPTDRDMDRLELLARSGGNPLYLVLPRQTGTYSDYYGLFRDGAVNLLIDKLSTRPHWIRVIDDADTVVFSYAEGGA